MAPRSAMRSPAICASLSPNDFPTRDFRLEVDGGIAAGDRAADEGLLAPLRVVEVDKVLVVPGLRPLVVIYRRLPIVAINRTWVGSLQAEVPDPDRVVRMRRHQHGRCQVHMQHGVAVLVARLVLAVIDELGDGLQRPHVPETQRNPSV